MMLAHKSAFASTILRTRTMVNLGKASFCMYLLQHPLVCAYSHFVKPAAGHEITYFVVFLVLLVSFSLVAHRAFEEPARRFVLAVARTQVAHANAADEVGTTTGVELTGRVPASEKARRRRL